MGRFENIGAIKGGGGGVFDQWLSVVWGMGANLVDYYASLKLVNRKQPNGFMINNIFKGEG